MKINPVDFEGLIYIGDYCAKKGTSAPLHVAWDKVKEAGLLPRVTH